MIGIETQRNQVIMLSKIINIIFSRSMMMKAIVSENIKLLNEISNLKIKLTELYSQNGPSTPEYISLSIKLDLLVNEYLDEKIKNLIHA